MLGGAKRVVSSKRVHVHAFTTGPELQDDGKVSRRQGNYLSIFLKVTSDKRAFPTVRMTDFVMSAKPQMEMPTSFAEQWWRKTLAAW